MAKRKKIGFWKTMVGGYKKGKPKSYTAWKRSAAGKKEVKRVKKFGGYAYEKKEALRDEYAGYTRQFKGKSKSSGSKSLGM